MDNRTTDELCVYLCNHEVMTPSDVAWRLGFEAYMPPPSDPVFLAKWRLGRASRIRCLKADAEARLWRRRTEGYEPRH